MMEKIYLYKVFITSISEELFTAAPSVTAHSNPAQTKKRVSANAYA